MILDAFILICNASQFEEKQARIKVTAPLRAGNVYDTVGNFFSQGWTELGIHNGMPLKDEQFNGNTSHIERLIID
jgi:hypothetical protein